MTWTDNRLGAYDTEGTIKGEDEMQVRKWGIQTRTPFEWMTYLTEETGELAEAISEYVYRNGDVADICKEAIQVATLAMKILNMAGTEKGPAK